MKGAQEQFPGLKHPDILKKIAEMWAALPAE